MKRVIAVILVLCMALSLCACSSSGSGSASGEKVVKIGVFEPSSGDSASGGKKEIPGMQYANSQEPTVTLGGETYKVELVYGDNGSSTDKAPSAASSLVSAGVSVVLGSYGSGVSMAGGPKFEEAGIPAIGITCTNPNVTAGNSYYFRICFLDNFRADVLANFAMSKFSAKTAYCLGESGNEYDQGLIAFFTKVFEAAGGKVITDSFPTGNSDFGSYLNKAKSEGADVIFTPVSIAYAVQIITQAASLGIEAPSSAPTRWTTTWFWKPSRAPTCSCTSPPSIRKAALPSLIRASRSTSTPAPRRWLPTAATTPSPPSPPWATTLTLWLWRP